MKTSSIAVERSRSTTQSDSIMRQTNKRSSRENKGTGRDSEGVGWDMSIPQKLFIDWLLSGSLFPETSASIPFPMFFEVVFIDKT